MSTPPRVTAIFFGRPGGGAFNAAGIAGLRRAAARMPVSVTEAWQADPAQRVASVEAAARESDLVIAHGGQGEEAVRLVAPAFPKVGFAVTQGRIAGPNIACFEVLQEQSAFLAGALAGWWITRGVAAHLSGEKVPPGLRGRAGFAAGLRHARPDARLLTGFCGNQHDPALAQAWTEAQAQAGAEVQFQMLDAGRPGAIAAARQAGLRCIGNVHDWTAEDAVFLASAIADNGVTMEAAIGAFLADRWEDRRIGLEDPAAVRLAYAADVAPELTARCEALRIAILGGAVEVPEHWAGEEWKP